MKGEAQDLSNGKCTQKLDYSLRLMFLTITTGIMHCAMFMYIKQRKCVRLHVLEGKFFGREKR